MALRRIVGLAVVGLLGLLAACAGPVAVGSLPLGGSSFAEARVYTCLDAPGRLHVTVESTEVTHPDVVKVEISDDATGGEDLFLVDSTTPGFFEGTSTKVHPAGSCPNLRIKLLCVAFTTCTRDWQGVTAESFRYTVSLVP